MVRKHHCTVSENVKYSDDSFTHHGRHCWCNLDTVSQTHRTYTGQKPLLSSVGQIERTGCSFLWNVKPKHENNTNQNTIFLRMEVFGEILWVADSWRYVGPVWTKCTMSFRIPILYWLICKASFNKKLHDFESRKQNSAGWTDMLIRLIAKLTHYSNQWHNNNY